MSREHNRGLRHGQLLAGLEGAIAMLHIAWRNADLLRDGDRERLRVAADAVAGIEQRALSLEAK